MPEFSAEDVVAMRRALRLATLSLGRTWPNPGVGCSIMRDGAFIGQGRHAVYGQAHAEVNALTQCQALGADPSGATAYLTLAPCTRHGRQPPCVEALIAAGISRVVAAVADPNQDDPAPRFDAAGITYEVGCCQAEAQHLHGGFLSRVSSGRPRLTGKWAMTLDGCLSTAQGDSAWISSPAALAFSRRRRRVFDAIVVGAGTLRRDDPELVSSHAAERTPVRVVICAQADLPEQARLIATRARAGVLVVHAPHAPAHRLQSLRQNGIELLAVSDPHHPGLLATALAIHGFNEVLVEGGAQVHGAFLRAGLYDRLELYLGAATLGGGRSVCAGSGVELMRQAQRWSPEEAPRLLGDTICVRLRRPQPPHPGEDLEPLVVVD